MAETFFMQAVSHALDRYNQRQMHEREVSSREGMAAADLKEKYYYAGIIKASNEREADLRSEQLGIAERAQRLQEDQANVNNEMVPLQNFKGVPGQIMRGFSPDGKNVRRGDVPAMMQSYVGWLNAMKMNQTESWRMGAMQKAEEQDAANRRNLYALMQAAEGGPTNLLSPEQTVKERKDVAYQNYRDAFGNKRGGWLLGGLAASAVSAMDDITHGASTFGPTDAQRYTDAARAMQGQMENVNAVLDAFADRRVNAQITPEMIGVLSKVRDRADATLPTLSRFADRAITNTLSQYNKRIGDFIDTYQYPDRWKLELSTADDLIRAQGQLRVAETRAKGR